MAKTISTPSTLDVAERPGFIRCVRISNNKVRWINPKLAANDLYMKRAGLMVQELKSPSKKKDEAKEVA